MAETVFKRGRHKGFTVVLRSAAQDSRLSLKARGLFLLMQSFPDDWTYTQYGLAKIAGVGRDQIRSALKELEDTGYLKAEQSHDAAGKFGGAVYVLQDEAPDAPEDTLETDVPPASADMADGEADGETEAATAENPPLSENPTTVENPPLSGKPMTGKPATGKPMTENPTLQNNKINNNNKHTPHTPQGAGAPEAAKWKPERFAAFWSYYRSIAQGRRVGNRKQAAKAWDKLKPDNPTIAAMGRALDRQAHSELWLRGIGIPYASTWINQRRWEDDDGRDTAQDGYAWADDGAPVDVEAPRRGEHAL